MEGSVPPALEMGTVTLENAKVVVIKENAFVPVIPIVVQVKDASAGWPKIIASLRQMGLGIFAEEIPIVDLENVKKEVVFVKIQLTVLSFMGFQILDVPNLSLEKITVKKLVNQRAKVVPKTLIVIVGLNVKRMNVLQNNHFPPVLLGGSSFSL